MLSSCCAKMKTDPLQQRGAPINCSREEVGSSACLRVKTSVCMVDLFDKAVKEEARNHSGN